MAFGHRVPTSRSGSRWPGEALPSMAAAPADPEVGVAESAPPARCWARMVVRSRGANVPNNDGNGTFVRGQKYLRLRHRRS